MGYSKRQPRIPIIAALAIVTVLVIAVLYYFLVSQTYLDPSFRKLRSQCETCEKAKALTAENFKEGTYEVVAWGLVSSESPTIKLAQSLERDYKIKTIFGGCIRLASIECYDREMRRLLVCKFGDTFVENTYEQVKKHSR